MPVEGRLVRCSMNVLGYKRFWTNLLIAIGGLALGLAAQGYLMRAATPMDGLLIYVLAALLFALALLRTPPLPDLPIRSSVEQPNQNSPRSTLVYAGWSTAFLLLSSASTVLSLALFASEEQPTLRWILHLAAIGLFIAAAYAAARIQGQRPTSESARPDLSGRYGGKDLARPSRWEIGVLVVILLVGLFMRLYRFHELPYGLWYDEADNGLSARQILTDPNYRPVYVSSTNLPAHFLYLVAGAFRVFGDSMYAIRAVAVLLGMLTIVAAYFCGRELGGPFVGVALAFLLAVSQWDVNWSRIGMHGVTVPLFELWVVAALLHGLRTRRLTSFAWVGVALGLGLCFYAPMRIFPVILAGFLLPWGVAWLRVMLRENPHRSWVRQTRHTLATWGTPALLVVTGTLVVVAPVAQFALRYPDAFWDRAKRISLFQYPEVQGRAVEVLLKSTAQHLLMFNYRGDPNGRHNMPGMAMLDQLSAVLFVLGVVACLVRWRQTRSVLLLLWLLVPLSGGILSVWFEAPQSLRAIGSLPAACALICLPMEWFAAEWRRVFPRPASQQRLVAVAAVFLLAIGLENGAMYFYFRGHDFASWAAFNPAETRLAQDINLYAGDYDLRFDPLLTAHLTTRYLAPDYTVYHNFDPATVFPLEGTDKKGILLFSAPDTRTFRDQAALLYPQARVETFAHPYTGSPVLFRHFFTQDDIIAVQGLDAIYVPLPEGEAGGQQVSAVDRQIDLHWDDDPPLPYPFGVTWTGGLLSPKYGLYQLRVEVPGECLLGLDGQKAFGGPGSRGRRVVMAQGVHALTLSCKITGAGPVRLMWTTPDETVLHPVPGYALYRSAWPIRGLVGRFYPNASWSGEPEFVRIDRQVSYYFHFLPLPRPYTVEWSGRLAVPVAGVYSLGVSAIKSAWLYVDGQPVVENSPPGAFVDGPVTLSAGVHELQLKFLDDQSHSQIYLYWQIPDGPRQLIPLDALLLPAEGAWWPAP